MAELLAPAGNIESLKAAVENGADAVYLGVNEFNARLKADNFTLENLPHAVEYAHLNGVKVYLVLNTALKDSELDRAVEIVKVAKAARVDAFIVTDLGFIRILNRTMSDIVLHFSTQTGIHNLEGAREAEKLGAKRIIVSRETTLKDIENIKQNTSLEIEAFIHGALCVSFSGNCLMSSFIGGNSGNRGTCMQPCRKQYKAFSDGKLVKNGYLLSTSDLCTLSRLRELIDSGVCSLKIEGRLRRSEYVAQVVKTYRAVLDGAIPTPKDFDSLKRIYNRGDFTEGYYYSDLKNSRGLMSINIQGHKGVFAGKVGESTKHFEGDAFKVLRGGKEIGSAIFEDGRLRFSSKDIAKDDELYITSDAVQLASLKVKNRRLPLSMDFFARIGEPARLEVRSGSIAVSVFTDFPVPEAVTAPLKEEDIRLQLEKLKDTFFECAFFHADIEGGIFLTKSQLNEMRRKAILKLKDKLLLNYYEQNG